MTKVLPGHIAPDDPRFAERLAVVNDIVDDMTETLQGVSLEEGVSAVMTLTNRTVGALIGIGADVTPVHAALQALAAECAACMQMIRHVAPMQSE